MLSLILKDSKYYLISYLITYPPLIVYWIIKMKNTDFILIVFVQILLMAGLIVLPPLFAEQDEDANKGYFILQMLPLTIREIMGAKFLLPIVNSLILLISNIFIFSFFNTDQEVIKIINSIQILTIVLCLFIIGLIYILIAKMRYINFLSFSSAGTVILTFLFVLMLKLFKVNFNELTQFCMDFFDKLNNEMTLIIGLLLYLLIYIITLKIERK